MRHRVLAALFRNRAASTQVLCRIDRIVVSAPREKPFVPDAPTQRVVPPRLGLPVLHDRPKLLKEPINIEGVINLVVGCCFHKWPG